MGPKTWVRVRAWNNRIFFLSKSRKNTQVSSAMSALQCSGTWLSEKSANCPAKPKDTPLTPNNKSTRLESNPISYLFYQLLASSTSRSLSQKTELLKCSPAGCTHIGDLLNDKNDVKPNPKPEPKHKPERVVCMYTSISVTISLPNPNHGLNSHPNPNPLGDTLTYDYCWRMCFITVLRNPK